MNLLELITNVLSILNMPVVYGWYDASLNAAHITFLEFDNVDSDYCDDDATSTEHYIQIDIWSKDASEAQTLKKQVKELLKTNGFLYQDGQDLYENDAQLWHIPSRWLYVENLDE